MPQTELQQQMQTEIKKLGEKLSYETLVKIQNHTRLWMLTLCALAMERFLFQAL